MIVKTTTMTKTKPESPQADPPRATLRQRLFARSLARSAGKYDELLRPHKERLFQDLSGTVLELGPGTGANLPYLPAGIHWIAVEPNPAMYQALREKAAAHGLKADIRHCAAERLDVPDGTVDAVVSSLVLCSVDDLEATLAEVHRVLKAGGRFIFLEHVAAPRGTWLRRGQNLVQPLWTLAADGCHPNRETGPALERAGFQELEYQDWQLDGLVKTPMIAGLAIKAAA